MTKKINRKIVFSLEIIAIGLALIFLVYYIINPAEQSLFDWCVWRDTTDGVILEKAYPLGAADRAGLKKGDHLISINGIEVKSMWQADSLLNKMELGQYGNYEIRRKGKILNFRVKNTTLHPMFYSYIFWKLYFWGFLIAGIIHILSLNVMIPIVRRNKKDWLTLVLILLSTVWIWGSLICQIIVTLQGSEFNWLFQLFFSIAFLSVTFIPALFVWKFFRDNLFFKSWKHRSISSLLLFIPGIFIYLLFMLQQIFPVTIKLLNDQSFIYSSYLQYLPYTFIVVIIGFMFPTKIQDKHKINIFLMFYCIAFLIASFSLLKFIKIRTPFTVI